MDGSEERGGGREGDKIDKGREEGWKEGVVEMKRKGGKMSTVEGEEGGARRGEGGKQRDEGNWVERGKMEGGR